MKGKGKIFRSGNIIDNKVIFEQHTKENEKMLESDR